MIQKLLFEEKSDYYDGVKEGLVIKDYDSDPQKFWKILHPDFDEKKKIAFGESHRDNPGRECSFRNYDNLEENLPNENRKDFDYDYLTKTRFIKAANRLLDTGKSKLSYSDLIDEVKRDIRKERHLNYPARDVTDALNCLIKQGKLNKIKNFLKKKA